MNKKLSIIIPCYNAEPYIYMLLKVLDPQITDDVEVILIDDGSDKPILKGAYKWCKVVRQKNQGISKARNKGLEMASGEVISFVDADDLVSENFVKYILSRIDEEWDYMDLSWKSLEDDHFWFKLRNDDDALTNPSASTRVFRRSFIGENRFPEKKDACEDEHFTRHLKIKDAKHICATNFMYFYRTNTPNRNSKRYMSGECNTKRIAYYFDHVSTDVSYLIDEFKKEDETNEVILITNRNDLPELEEYSQVFCPARPTRAIIARGEPTKLIEIIEQPIKSQIVIWTSVTFEIGGIETFIRSYVELMHKEYDITILYDSIGTNQLIKLSKMVRCVKNNINKPVYCDTLIINRIIDSIPPNIHYNKSVQMVHCLKHPSYHIPQDRDVIVNVSQASKDSFGEEAENAIVIHNPILESEESGNCLLLVSAIRVDAADKQGNDKRCIQFAQKLTELKIPFIWVYFGDKAMLRAPSELSYGGLKENMKPYLDKADYLVQLSGAEAYSYSLLESLVSNTPVIVTPLEQNKDMGIEDGKNGYVFPFDASEWTDDMMKRIVQIPQFKYEYEKENENIKKAWKKILGKPKKKSDYKPIEELSVMVKREYFDIKMQKAMRVKETAFMSPDRAYDLRDKGFVEIIG